MSPFNGHKMIGATFHDRSPHQTSAKTTSDFQFFYGHANTPRAAGHCRVLLTRRAARAVDHRLAVRLLVGAVGLRGVAVRVQSLADLRREVVLRGERQAVPVVLRSEEHTSELQSRGH